MNTTETHPTVDAAPCANAPAQASGVSWYSLRVRLVGSPGALTDLVGVFSTLNLGLSRLEFVQPASGEPASVVARYRAGRQAADLIPRKLGRLIEVLSVEQQGDLP